MLKGLLKIWLPLALSALVVVGCSKSGGGDAVDPNNTKQLLDMSAMAKQADGNYDKLTADGKQQILKMANGDEKQARTLLQLMAHPPNSGVKGPPSGGPPARSVPSSTGH
jgi:hypothetical protein